MVMVFRDGAGTLTCCNQAMTLQTENTKEASKEKHVPVLERSASGYKVKVGAVPHPMEEKHYIEWIELVAGDTLHCAFLKPGDAPEAEFQTPAEAAFARDYCNLHGYWKG
jgi:superoxide reductase